MKTFDVVIIGAGIVGLSTAMHLGQTRTDQKILVIEKESQPAMHQSSHNSGVIHSGIYYKPGSFRAEFCRAGCQSMAAFCRAHDIAHDICGKVIVATDEEELPRLESLYQRGLQNQLKIEKIGPERVNEIEPHVSSLGGLWIASTGITDYQAVCHKYAELFEADGGQVQLNTRLENVIVQKDRLVLETSQGDIESKFAINCAGLHSDRIAQLWGLKPDLKIVPFRGEYYELVPERRSLINNIIYPLPNPKFPFLGVHFTRGIDGNIHIGPNAVLGYKREGYRKTDFDFRDFAESITYSGFWNLALPNMGEGVNEMVRSWSKRAFLKNIQQMVPGVQLDDIVPAGAGVRAMALGPDGSIIDDFMFVDGPRSLHVLNAPSPAATSSLEIGKAITERATTQLQ